MSASSASTRSCASTTARTACWRAGSRSRCRPACASLPTNKGIEAPGRSCRTGLPLAGTLIAISERGLDKAGNIIGFLIGGPRPGTLHGQAQRQISTSATPRSCRAAICCCWSASSAGPPGSAVRIRRIALGEIKPGALVDGPVLFEADLGYEIDNMEGFSVHRSAGGEIVLTLISDDNFSLLQRTLLLQFTLAEP